MSFVDSSGLPQGILIDLWREIGRREGVNIEFKLVDWQPSIDLVASGKADIHAGLMFSEQRDTILDFSAPINVPYASRLMVSRKLNISNMSEIGEVPVCVVRGAYEIDFINRHYDAVQLVLKENARACVQAAIDGEVLAFTLDYTAAMYFLHKAGKPDQFYVADTLYVDRLRAAVSQSNTELARKVNNALYNLPSDEYSRIIQKWILVEPTIPQWFYPAIVLIATFLFACFALFYIITLKKQVAKRTYELQVLSQTDSLTSLYNRPKLDEICTLELERYKRYLKPFSLIMLDIDHFKKINDTYGHAKGDAVLIELAQLLKSNVRNADSVGRWGGKSS